MSGGRFDYDQYKLQSLSEDIQEIIDRNNPLNPGDRHSPEIIARYKEAVYNLERTYQMVRRIDWLESQDDGPESFMERWDTEVPPTWGRDIQNKTTMDTTPEYPFTTFPKMARLQREVIISEKIDGTNAQIYITDDGEMLTGSRNRWITPEDDHYGFARWATDHKDELMQLGPGRHFGEWWGRGIQRNYGLSERKFSLFNVARWCLRGMTPMVIPTADPRTVKTQDILPACCDLVPILHRGVFTSVIPAVSLWELSQKGSKAALGYMHPEGIVVFHVAGNVGFKMTLDNDGVPKSSLKS